MRTAAVEERLLAGLRIRGDEALEFVAHVADRTRLVLATERGLEELGLEHTTDNVGALVRDGARREQQHLAVCVH